MHSSTRTDIVYACHKNIERQWRSQAGATIGGDGPLGRLLIRGEAGQDTIDRLAAREGELVLDKSTYGAFASTCALARAFGHSIRGIG